jgi:hypothetical protein
VYTVPQAPSSCRRLGCNLHANGRPRETFSVDKGGSCDEIHETSTG